LNKLIKKYLYTGINDSTSVEKDTGH